MLAGSFQSDDWLPGDDGTLFTSFDYKLYTDLRDARVGPEVVVLTSAGKHGTKLK